MIYSGLLDLDRAAQEERACERRRRSPEQGLPRRGIAGVGQSGLQGSIRAGFWSWSTAMACVIHWRPWLGSRRSVVALAAAAVGLRGEARRRVACRPSQCGNLGARDSWSLCEARASQCGACVGLRSAAGCSPRRARGAAAALHRRAGILRPWACVRAYKLAQKDQGLGRVLTVHWIRWRRGAGVVGIVLR